MKELTLEEQQILAAGIEEVPYESEEDATKVANVLTKLGIRSKVTGSQEGQYSIVYRVVTDI